MLQIRLAQLAPFQTEAERRFEYRLAEHLREFFPLARHSMDASERSHFIHFVHEKAKNLGFTSERAVCMMLNCVLFLGSEFLTDPMYPWAAAILQDQRLKNPAQRIERLADKALDVFQEFHGPDGDYLDAAVARIVADKPALLAEINAGNLDGFKTLARRLYPEKYDVVGSAALDALLRRAKETAPQYGLKTGGGVLMTAIAMFLAGVGFDTDPQFVILNRPLHAPDKSEVGDGVETLFAALMNLLAKFNTNQTANA